MSDNNQPWDQPTPQSRRRGGLETENRILLTLLRGGEMTQKEIAGLTRFSQATVTKSLNNLHGESEITRHETSSGRVRYRAVTDRFHVIGVSIINYARLRKEGGGFELSWKATAQLADRSGQECHSELEVSTGEDSDVEFEHVTAVVAELVNNLKDAATNRGLTVGALGIELSGHVDGKTGSVVYSPSFKWHDEPLAEKIVELTSLPTYVENDVNAIALRDQLSAERPRNFALVLLSEGVGAAVVANRRLLHGWSGGAGELGHLRAVPTGELCRCGHYGCIETVASYVAIREAGRREKIRDPERPNEDELPRVSWIVQEADLGVTAAQNILREAASALSVGVIALCGLLQPEEVVISSTAMEKSRFFKTCLREFVRQGVFETCMPRLTFVPTDLHNAVGGSVWAAILKAPRLSQHVETKPTVSSSVA